MSILIDLEEPFKSKWQKGYLITQADGRRSVILFNTNEDRSTIAYARYLLSVKEGFEIPEEIEVDHRDGDKTNDDINNLRPMTKEMHRMKTYHLDTKHEKTVMLQCPQCNEWFERTERYVRDKQKQGHKTQYCSRSCSSKANPPTASAGRGAVSPELAATIKRMHKAGLSSYKISAELSIARNTVMKYW